MVAKLQKGKNGDTNWLSFGIGLIAVAFIGFIVIALFYEIGKAPWQFLNGELRAIAINASMTSVRSVLALIPWLSTIKLLVLSP